MSPFSFYKHFLSAVAFISCLLNGAFLSFMIAKGMYPLAGFMTLSVGGAAMAYHYLTNLSTEQFTENLKRGFESR